VRPADVLAAGIVGLLVFGASTLALRARNVKKVRKRLDPHVRAALAGPKPAAKGKRSLFGPLYALTEGAFGRLTLWSRLRTSLERADWSMGPAQFVWVALASAFAPAFLLVLVGAPGALAVIFFPFGGAVPFVLLHVKGSKRQRVFDDQLPQLLLTMAASVRVGHSFRQAMQAVVHEGIEPAKKEFARVLFETDLGRPVDQALSEMATRLGSQNFEYVIQAVSIQREAGGSLAELFDLVSETVRHRQQFLAKVRALTAMGRLSSYILAVLPFVAVALLTAINPDYTKPLFDNSTGHLLIFIALTGIVIGFICLKKIVSFRLS
jgi:tight adherence protein B